MFEAVTGALIFFGDHLGAVFYLGSLIVGLIAKYGVQILGIMNWSQAQRLEVIIVINLVK